MSAAAAAFVAYARLVADMREALEIINGLRVNIALGNLVPTEQLNNVVQGIAVPFLQTSTNNVFFEPAVLPLNVNVACTVHVARGEGNVVVNAVDPDTVQVITPRARTSYRGGALCVLRLLRDEAQITVTFSNGEESLQRLFQLTRV